MRFIFLILFFVFVAIWAVMAFAAHVAGFAVHLLLVLAVGALILHFVRGSSRAA